jgi:UDP-N-acetyl-D-glucosamine dehydrogenase
MNFFHRNRCSVKRIKVAIQGLGFVGAAMAAAVSQAQNESGEPLYDVVGVDLPSPSGRARVDAINGGKFPFETTDMSLSDAIRIGHETRNLRASIDPDEFEDAAVIVVDIHLDVDFGAKPPRAKFDNFLAGIRTIAAQAKPGALVLIETTVPPGTTENLIKPEIEKILAARGLDPASVNVAHSYERVMPGRDYLSSITNFWRVYSGCNEASAKACEAFLSSIINVGKYPLTRLKRPVDTETAKVMENSFRAVNIAFLEEWAQFSERAGVDLPSVVQAIRMRPTHQNIMLPGFGVGGYCLTKDPLLVGVGAREFFGLRDAVFPFCEAAVEINARMPRGTLAVLKEALSGLAGKRILLLGATYREGVADTRYSPSGAFADWLDEEHAVVDVHDPMVEGMEGSDRAVMRHLPSPDGYDAVVFAVGHDTYRKITPSAWLGEGRPLVVDANFVLTRQQLESFGDCGCAVKVRGRGDL